MHTSTTPLKALAVSAASAGLLLTGGFVAAAAGALPDAAQATARDMLATINVEVPGADEHSAGHADTRGRSADAPAGRELDAADTESEPTRHGEMISDLARTTDLEGRDKGMAISQAARTNGQAAEHGSAQTPEQSATGGGDVRAPEARPAAAGDGGQSDGHARVETPNQGGTGTADDASTDNGGSSSTHGTGTAGEMSGGRSAAGSGNAP
jgi:hypothetical protein